MPNKLVLTGIDELRVELKSLPATLQAESDPIVRARATKAQAQIVAGYPEVTGRLRAGVKVLPQSPGQRRAAVYTLVSDAPYARILEFGSARIAPRALFLPITETERRAAVVDVVSLVESKGLDVRGGHD